MRAHVVGFLPALGRRRRAAAAAAVLLPLALSGCGSESSGAPSTVAVASPSPAAGALDMALLSHLDLPTLAQAPAAAQPVAGQGAALSAAGNWGYTTAGGRRFALTGLSTGLSIVEVTDAARPRNVALIPGLDSQWREIRTYGEYVYTTTEASWGLDILSMKDPDHPRRIQTWNKTFRTAHSLKGAVGHFGARATEAAAARLERLGREENLAEAPGALEALEDALRQLEPALRELLS